MTRKGFNERYDAFRRSGSPREAGILCLALVAMVAPVLFLRDPIEEHYGPTFSNIFLLVMLFLILGMILALTCWLGGRLVKKFGLGCPTCGCNLADKDRRRKALVTGSCPKCGNKVFDDKPFSPASGCLDREEFTAEHAAWLRRTNREAIKVIIIIFIVSIVCVPLTKYFQRLVDGGGLDWVTVTQWRWFTGLMLGAVCFAAFGIFVFAFRGKFKRVRELPCPECNRSLAGGAGKMAVKTEMCIYCGCRLFEALPPRS